MHLVAFGMQNGEEPLLGLSRPIDLRMMRERTDSALCIMRHSQVQRPKHEYDLYLTLYITSSGGW